MSEDGSTPVAPAPQAQPADAENNNATANTAKPDSAPIVPVIESKVEDAEESKPADPEPAKESEEEAAKPEGNSFFTDLPEMHSCNFFTDLSRAINRANREARGRV